MAGLLVTSIVSGQLISRSAATRRFPIAGTAVMSVGMLLLTRLEVHTASPVAMLDAAIVGLGPRDGDAGARARSSELGAVRGDGRRDERLDAVPQVGGSIGVSLFGAIFAARERSELAKRLPAGVHIPRTTNPEVIRHLPLAARKAFTEAFSVALHPVFLMAGAISFVSFLLAWMIRETPLRTKSQAGEAAAAAAAGAEA